MEFNLENKNKEIKLVQQFTRLKTCMFFEGGRKMGDG
jgi:hypothetical protein